MSKYYYLTVYARFGERIASYKQEILRQGVWLNWLEAFPAWKVLSVMTSDYPGPNQINPCNPEYRGKLVSMWDFLINQGMLPPRPSAIYHQSVTDLEKPPDELVEDIRNDISKLRGKLEDVGRAYPLWKDWLATGAGGLTCVLVQLYSASEEMRKHREKWGHRVPWLSKQ